MQRKYFKNSLICGVVISGTHKKNIFGEYLPKIFTPFDIILYNKQSHTITLSFNSVLPVSLNAQVLVKLNIL